MKKVYPLLKQMIGIRKIGFFTISVAILVFVGIGSGEEKLETPEDVVKAFITARSNFNPLQKNLKYCPNITKFLYEGEKYLNQELGIELGNVIAGFKILKVDKDAKNATVTVKHYFCGSCGTDIACNTKLTKQVGIYKLKKINNEWKITKWPDDNLPCEGLISIDNILKTEEELLKDRKNLLKKLLTKGNIETSEIQSIKGEIKTLEAQLKNFKTCKKKVASLIGGGN